MPARARRQPLVLLAPDKLKGTLTARRAVEALAAAAVETGWDVDRCPLSDGGEGFREALAPAGAATLRTTVTGPLGAPVEAAWVLEGGRAVVESAAASGLALAGGAAGNDPLAATSRGTGELVLAAVAAGAADVLVGVGGSATTDGGLGAVEAIDAAGGLRRVRVVVACDVETRFSDAAAAFGPQKGAGPEQVRLLEERLRALARQYRERYGVDVEALVGGGAAGGLAGGLAALGARLVPGFDVVARTVDLPSRLGAADLVVTAEGRLDGPSWQGKVVGGVCRLAAEVGTPALVVAGSADGEGRRGAADHGVELVVLDDRFGERAVEEPAACLAEAARTVLAGGPRSRS
ncbi:MAG TPA: glycerate kinase [Acidimicrobiales bacterium]|nr:glycerate kinase [Acidimicrobiales bacterium]